jgi:hypothetical protein
MPLINNPVQLNVSPLPSSATFENAADVAFVPTGDIAATNVQAAIAEVGSETQTALNAKADIIHTHAASGITSTTNIVIVLPVPGGGFNEIIPFAHNAAATNMPTAAAGGGIIVGTGWDVGAEASGRARSFAMWSPFNSSELYTTGFAVGGTTLGWNRIWGDANIASQAEAEAGTNNTKGMTPLRVKQAIDASGGGNYYESADLTITTAALLTIAHGLSAAPNVITARLKCVVAEAGWSVDEEPTIALGWWDSGNRTTSVWADATNVYVKFSTVGTCMTIGHKTTTIPTALTNTSWRLKLIAEVK